MIAIMADAAAAAVAPGGLVEQLEALIAAALIALSGAVWAALRAWFQAKTASLVNSSLVKGVERAPASIRTAIDAHLGPEVLAALKAQGIDVDALPEKFAAAIKAGIQATATESGAEPALAKIVKKETAERPAYVEPPVANGGGAS